MLCNIGGKVIEIEHELVARSVLLTALNNPCYSSLKDASGRPFIDYDPMMLEHITAGKVVSDATLHRRLEYALVVFGISLPASTHRLLLSLEGEVLTLDIFGDEDDSTSLYLRRVGYKRARLVTQGSNVYLVLADVSEHWRIDQYKLHGNVIVPVTPIPAEVGSDIMCEATDVALFVIGHLKQLYRFTFVDKKWQKLASPAQPGYPFFLLRCASVLYMLYGETLISYDTEDDEDRWRQVVPSPLSSNGIYMVAGSMLFLFQNTLLDQTPICCYNNRTWTLLEAFPGRISKLVWYNHVLYLFPVDDDAVWYYLNDKWQSEAVPFNNEEDLICAMGFGPSKALLTADLVGYQMPTYAMLVDDTLVDTVVTVKLNDGYVQTTWQTLYQCPTLQRLYQNTELVIDATLAQFAPVLTFLREGVLVQGTPAIFESLQISPRTTIVGVVGLSFGHGEIAILLEKNTWHVLENRPLNRRQFDYASICAYQGRCYLVGGGCDSVEYLDLIDFNWQTLDARLPRILEFATMTRTSVDKMFVVGSSGNNAFVYAYVNDLWVEESVVPGSDMLYTFALTSIGTKLYLIGGTGVKVVPEVKARKKMYKRPETSKKVFSDVVKVYDTITKAWSFGPKLPSTRYNASACSLNGKIYLGGDPSGSILVWNTLDPVATWMELDTPTTYGKVFEFGDRVHLPRYSYDPVSNMWSPEPVLDMYDPHFCTFRLENVCAFYRDKLYDLDEPERDTRQLMFERPNWV
jgi:hypothetical protein